MSKTFVEKIFSKKTGKDVYAGEEVSLSPDVILSHDNTSAIYSMFKESGHEKVVQENNLVIILDHSIPAGNEQEALSHKITRAFVKTQNIPHFFDAGRGICHQVMIEEGFALPGKILLGADSHMTTHGAFGAFATGISNQEAAQTWSTGEYNCTVPETIKIVINGTPKNLITAKDVFFFLADTLKIQQSDTVALEFSGSYIESLPLSERIVFSNMTAELGAVSGYIAPDGKIFDYIYNLETDHQIQDYTVIYPDADASYKETIEIDVTNIDFMTAAPHSIDNIKNVKDVLDTPVHQVLIGACTSGRIEDFRMTAEILKDRKIHKDTRLLIIPASNKVYLQAIAEGIISTFIKAGAIILNPAGGSCSLGGRGALAPDEICVSTFTENTRGAMGSDRAAIYLTSPYVAAASAIKGVIATPDELWREIWQK